MQQEKMFSKFLKAHKFVRIKGDTPKKNEKKSLFQFLLNLKLENICELMQKTASPYLFPFQNYGRMKLTCTDILLYKNDHFLRQIRV